VNFAYTIEALFNEPPTSAGSTISDYEIAIGATSPDTYYIHLDAKCDDPESDTLTYQIMYQGKAYDDASSDLKTILSFATDTQKLSIDTSIRTLY
jgi:hypothetical protein